MQKLVEKFKSMSKTKRDIIVLSVLVALVVLFTALFMFADFGNPGVKKYAEKGSFDTRFYYNADDVYETLDGMDPSVDIRHHLIFHIVDYVYMVVYFLFFVAAGLFFGKGKYRLLCYILPFVLVFFDLIENIFLDAVMMIYGTRGERLDILANIAGVATLLKTVMLAVNALFILLLAALYIADSVKKAKTEAVTEPDFKVNAEEAETPNITPEA